MQQGTLFLFDVDGTLIRSFMRETGEAEDYDKIEVLPERLGVLRELRKNPENRFALVTNQGGAAFGHQTTEQIGRKLGLVLEALEFPEPETYTMCYAASVTAESGEGSALYVSFVHPKATNAEFRSAPDDDWRKPGCGMLRKAMTDFGFPANRTVFVGDMATDEAAALAAGVIYIEAQNFFDPGFLAEASLLAQEIKRGEA